MLAFTGCNADSYELAYETEISDYKNLIRLFEEPPSEFRSAPFWIWHEIITEEEIRQSLEDLKEQGFGGVFVHPRYGMVTEYLSDEWYDLFQHTLDVAEELDMYVWIYDENSYPSGFAGGHVPYQMPDSYKHGQALRMHKTDRFQPDPDLRYLHYFEIDDSGEIVEITDVDERTGDTGQFIMFEIVTYPQTKWYAGYSYVDLLYPGVTEKFMDITMQGYKERFGEHFGKLIPGVFTDEPNIAPPGWTVVRWTPDLYEEFEKRWGYRLQDNLLSLFEEAGDWKKVRHNHFQLLLQMFIDRWSKPWFEYTEKHQLKWTGHYWEHGWPRPHHGGDNMAMYAWHQIPGIDLLFNTMYTDERPDQFGRIRNVKELRSAANQTGRTRTLSESYGGSGWEITFEDMKRLGDWMYVLGVNFLNQHMTYMTILGDRKTDYPQSFSYHSPWWNLYGKQNDYFARLSVAMSAGKQKNNILVIEPTTSAWMYYSGYSPNKNLNQIGDSFNVLLEKLEQHQIAYDLGSENIIKDIGSADNGRFVVGEAEYDLVVLPSGMENIDESTFRLLEHYLESGGKVVSLVTTPSRIDGMRSEAVASIIDKYGDQWLQAACFTDGNVYDLFENKRIRFSRPAMQSEWFFHHKRDLDDGRLILLVNSEPEEAVKGNFQTKGRQAIKLDPHTGDATLYPFLINGDDIIVDFSVNPAGSLLLFIADKNISVPAGTIKPETNIIVETQKSKVKPLAPNMMTLDYGELFIEGKSLGNMFFQSADEKVWQHYGYNENPWYRSAQFKTELLDADTFAIDTGFEFVFNFHIEEGTDMSSINAVAERPQIFKMSVNGVSLEPIRDKWFLDRDLAVYSIGEHLHAGENNIRLKVNPMSMLAELQPVYLTGNFFLKNAEKGWNLAPIEPLSIGSWKESGFPFYSDRVMYTKTHSFSDVPERVVVELGDWKGTVAEVRVNDHFAGIIQQPPYKADITNWVVTGDNKVEVTVYGSNKNLLGPHHNVTLRGIVRPGDFLSAPEVQPPGEEYDLFDYGLMEDFKIVTAGFSKAGQHVEKPCSENSGERLYNGIVLSKEWPPRNIDPVNQDPMPIPYLDHPPAVIPIDVGRQLFVDDFLIDVTDLQRNFHYPEKYKGNPVLKPETPLELATAGAALTVRRPDLATHPQPLAGPKSGGMWWNPEKQLFEFWYEAGWLGTICYAISRDGLHWERPELDIRPGTNQAVPDEVWVDSWTVVRDWWTDDPQAAYKMFISTGPRLGDCYVSPDGIHWSEGVKTGIMGDRSTMFYNPFRSKWVFSIRTNFRGRSRHYWEANDFMNDCQWPSFETKGPVLPPEGAPVIWAAADRMDQPDPEIGDPPQLYNLDAVAYESIMLGMFEIHLGPPNEICAEQATPKITDIHFAYSRDGFHWSRPDRTAAVRAERRDGTWDKGYVQPLGNICTIHGDRLFFYYSAFAGDPANTNKNHNNLNGMYSNGATGVAFLRRDGFVSMYAEDKPGTLMTRPVTFSGKQLFVNVNATDGVLRAEVLDKDGNPIEPFTMAKSIPVSGDSTLEAVQWEGGSDLSVLAGKPVRFRFELTNGSLYAFWVSQDESGRSDGYVAGGGPGYTGPKDTVGRAALK